MKKLLLSILICLVCTITVNAQNYIDVVYLKNGSIIKGLIVEQVPNVSLKIETSDGSTIICSMTDVTKITKEINTLSTQRRVENTNIDPIYGGTLRPTNPRPLINNSRTIGYEGSADLMGGVAVDPLGTSKMQITTTHGYRFSPYFYMGAGIGYQYDLTTLFSHIPIFMNLKANFTKSAISPFLSVDCGYAIGFKSIYTYNDQRNNGGFLISPMAGITIKNKNQVAINIGIGYHLQQVVLLSADQYNNGLLSKPLFGSLTFKVGVSF